MSQALTGSPPIRSVILSSWLARTLTGGIFGPHGWGLVIASRTSALARRGVLIRPLLTSAVLLLSACTADGADAPRAQAASGTAAARWDASRVDTLVRLGREDQAGRAALAQAAAAQDTATLFASLRADSARTRWLRAAVARSGWPSGATVGDSARQAAWLILQHSPDTAWQAAMLPDLERLAAAGELPPADVALLVDRILVHRGQLQRYGSQFDMADGRLVPAPVDDVAGLDARRARVGLPPMAEYVRLLAERTQLPVVWPPPAGSTDNPPRPHSRDR